MSCFVLIDLFICVVVMASSPELFSSPVIGRADDGSCRRDSDSPITTHRRIRALVSSDSESDVESQTGAESVPNKGSLSAVNGADNCDVSCPVSSQLVEERLEFLRDTFPHIDAMELQDVLARHGWCVESAIDSLSDMGRHTSASPVKQRQQRTSQSPVAPSIKRRRLMVHSDSDSDDGGGGEKVAPSAALAATPPFRRAVCRTTGGGGKKRSSLTACHADEDELDFHHQTLVYVSDSDEDASDSEIDNSCGGGARALAALRERVLNYLNSASVEELLCMSGCSKKKADLITSLRPFSQWQSTVSRFKSLKTLSPDMLNSASEVLRMRAALDHLLRQCEKIARRLKARVTSLIDESNSCDVITKQPALLDSSRSLSHYQMIGLSWLVLMYREKINAILADEMGLGKTIQAISFLAYLKMENAGWKHLIVVPSSILDNWLQELSSWCPALKVIAYRGSVEERRAVRMVLVRGDPQAWDVVVTTYNLVASSPEDKGLFRNLSFKYIVFDEAHMLKNMMSKRYNNLTRLKGDHRLLLTGTPLQNNLLELASLLLFVMPNVFATARGSLSTIFDVIPKSGGDSRSQFECARIEEARRIMAPFFLRRLKHHVLRDLPEKRELIERVDMTTEQQRRYRALSDALIKQKTKGALMEGEVAPSAMGVIMAMRKLSNHPLLLRHHYTEQKLCEIARVYVRLPGHEHKEELLVREDLSVMSDFEIHTMCANFDRLRQFRLDQQCVLASGKFGALDRLLPRLVAGGHRVLVFSQFVIMLDVMEEYMTARGYRYLRLDGQTPVADRQALINKYNSDSSIFVFLLSTRAGGLGINLTSADRVILHDIDYNPHNDRQAEDRCHRIGQIRPVEVIKLACRGSIDECMLKIAHDKLRLADDLASDHHCTNTDGETERAERPEDMRKLLELVLQES